MQEKVYNVTYLFWKYYLWNLDEWPPIVETDDISEKKKKSDPAKFEVEIHQNTRVCISNLYLLYAIQITNVFTVLHKVLEVKEEIFGKYLSSPTVQRLITFQ